MMKSEYYQYSIILFRKNYIEVSYLDEIRIEFFLDNIELHRLCLENSDNLMSEYIDKIYNNLIEWQSKLDNNITDVANKSE